MPASFSPAAFVCPTLSRFVRHATVENPWACSSCEMSPQIRAPLAKGAQEMSNFVLVYTGGSRPASEAEGKKVMEAWGAWFGKLGDKVVDPGNPFAPNAKNPSNGS